MLILNDFKKNKLISLIFTLPSIYLMPNPFKIYEFKELLKDVNFSKSDIILDLGCGNGLQSILIGQKCKIVYGIDVSEDSITIARIRSRYNHRSNCRFKEVTIEKAGFRNDSFDKIISICVIEHIKNYTQVLNKAYFLLKKGGDMLFSVDSFSNIEENKIIQIHKTKFRVERYFQKNELVSLLEKIGFKDIRIYYIFKSEYAKFLIEKGIKNDLKFGFGISYIQYLKLKKKEAKNIHKDKGLFLIVKCKK